LNDHGLKSIQPGGVILFRRNIEEAEQTYRFLAGLSQFFISRPLFRCVDVEGGLVDRLRDLVAPMPSLAAVAASGKKSLYLKHGKLIGREARALGFNTVVLAPVLDLALPESQSGDADKKLFSGTRKVIAYAERISDGLESLTEFSVAGSIFPGLGGGALDSHHATPVIDQHGDVSGRTTCFPTGNSSRNCPW
jgi:beta-N-acetylhexosaminidase